MKQRIFRTLCVFSFFGVIIATLLTLAIAVPFCMNQVEQSIRSLTGSLAAVYADMSEQDFVHALSSLPDNTRATLIKQDGTVLYDSVASAPQLENHLDRPEIQSALEQGTGESSRCSSTEGSATYYYASKLVNGDILRLSRKYSNIYGVLTGVIFVSLALMVALAAGAFSLSRRLTRWLIRPVVDMANNISQADSTSVYDELVPVIQHVQEQNRQIRSQMDSLRRERDTVNAITGNMREGMLLIAKQKNILTINPSAIRMLTGGTTNPSKFIGASFRTVNRTEEWFHCVDEALSGNSSDAELHLRGAIYHLYASPVLSEGQVEGVVAIVLDETQQRLAEKSRQEFSANVSHELKTPLTSISGYAEMMALGMVANASDQKEFARQIHKEAMRLIALINDIIRLSRIEEAPPEPFIPVDLREIADSVLETLTYTAKQSNVTLHETEGNATIPGDPAMLQELLMNLCSNSVKYNRPGGGVWVTLSETDTQAVITVRDNGIGIPEDSQKRVFERFYRVDKSRSKQTGGTGLGLSIVKHVVEYHGGQVELDSRPNMGTQICVMLPKK